MTSSWRHSLKAAGLGRLLYQMYHRPLGWCRDLHAEGGPWNRRQTRLGRLAMESAAENLPALPVFSGQALELHLLTGRRFWYQTAFCLWTFARHARRSLAPVIYDDGTLDPTSREPLVRLFPKITFVSREESRERLATHLPVARHPVLNERWRNYPNIRKLIDPHLGRSGWRLVIDSDLLFFREPSFLLAWLDRPTRPLHAVDCTTSYGYSPGVMRTMAGTAVPERINVGLTGLNGAMLDWDRFEYWSRQLGEAEGTSYYLEQALVALLVAPLSCDVAPAEDYVTLPQVQEAIDCRAIMHHYVAGSKRWYFQRNWRRAIEA